MSALVLDAGAFVAVERNDRAMMARLRVAQRSNVAVRTNAIVISQGMISARSATALLSQEGSGIERFIRCREGWFPKLPFFDMRSGNHPSQHR